MTIILGWGSSSCCSVTSSPISPILSRNHVWQWGGNVKNFFVKVTRELSAGGNLDRQEFEDCSNHFTRFGIRCEDQDWLCKEQLNNELLKMLPSPCELYEVSVIISIISFFSSLSVNMWFLSSNVERNSWPKGCYCYAYYKASSNSVLNLDVKVSNVNEESEPQLGHPLQFMYLRASFEPGKSRLIESWDCWLITEHVVAALFLYLSISSSPCNS